MKNRELYKEQDKKYSAPVLAPLFGSQAPPAQRSQRSITHTYRPLGYSPYYNSRVREEPFRTVKDFYRPRTNFEPDKPEDNFDWQAAPRRTHTGLVGASPSGLRQDPYH